MNIREEPFIGRQSVAARIVSALKAKSSFASTGREGYFRQYTNKGYSGKNTDLSKFQELMADIKRVVVYKLDRISRSILDFTTMMETFQAYNVEFVSSTEKSDTSTPIGRAMLNIYIVFAQLDSTTIQGTRTKMMKPDPETADIALHFADEGILIYDKELDPWLYLPNAPQPHLRPGRPGNVRIVQKLGDGGYQRGSGLRGDKRLLSLPVPGRTGVKKQAPERPDPCGSPQRGSDICGCVAPQSKKADGKHHIPDRRQDEKYLADRESAV